MYVQEGKHFYTILNQLIIFKIYKNVKILFISDSFLFLKDKRKTKKSLKMIRDRKIE